MPKARDPDLRMTRAQRWSAKASQATGEDPSHYLGEAWIISEKMLSNTVTKGMLLAELRHANENSPEEEDEQPNHNALDECVMAGEAVLANVDNFYTRKLVTQALMRLSPREHRVLALLHGIGCHERTQVEVAEEFGLTQARIMQIANRAMRRLKHPSYSRSLRQCMPGSVRIKDE